MRNKLTIWLHKLSRCYCFHAGSAMEILPLCLTPCPAHPHVPLPGGDNRLPALHRTGMAYLNETWAASDPLADRYALSSTLTDSLSISLAHTHPCHNTHSNCWLGAAHRHVYRSSDAGSTNRPVAHAGRLYQWLYFCAEPAASTLGYCQRHSLQPVQRGAADATRKSVSASRCVALLRSKCGWDLSHYHSASAASLLLSIRGQESCWRLKLPLSRQRISQPSVSHNRL
jgi:hypothetical protein